MRPNSRDAGGARLNAAKSALSTNQLATPERLFNAFVFGADNVLPLSTPTFALPFLNKRFIATFCSRLTL
jgi:hypothetical protein